MVFLFLDKVNEQKAKVMCIHNFPEMLSDIEKQGGVLVDSVDDAVEVEGKIALPYYNYETKDVYYEYIDKPKTEIELLQEQFEIRLAQSNIEMFEMMIAVQGGNL